MASNLDFVDVYKNLDIEKKFYLRYKFPHIRYQQQREPLTEQGFLRLVQRKTLNAFIEWEKTAEYKAIVTLILQAQIGNDLYEIFQVVRDKALTGDDKAVKLYLQLQKEISNYAKQAQVIFGQEPIEIEEDDGLVLE